LFITIIMKRIAQLLTIACAVFLIACSKNVSGGIEKTDKVAQLFQQVKNDPNYIKYYKMIMLYSDAFMANGKKSVENEKRTGQSDSALLLNNNVPLEQKYKQLGYTNYELVMGNTMKMYELQKYMSITYPVMRELTEAERIKFAQISRNYIKSLNQ
jgi:hypothetical protein